MSPSPSVSLELRKRRSSNQPGGQEAYDDDSAYWILVDTVNKSIQVHTSDNDGEPCTYDITLDTKAGFLTIADNLGNSLEMDSAQGNLTITMTNEVVINAKKFIVNASESSVETTKQKSITAESLTMDAASMKSTGGIGMEGPVSIKGPSTIEGDLNVDGNIKATGNITP